MNDAAGGLIETATFCKTGDEKRPSIVGLPDFSTQQVCPDDLTMGVDEVADAVPTFWYTRVEFDRLLDPNVEDLIPNIDPNTNMPDGTFTGSLENTQPVTLTCGSTAVAYNGYYSPSGNNVTWPVGPSLFIQPTNLQDIATSSECEITIKDVVKGKNGAAIDPASVGGSGKYVWKIAPLTLTGTDPVGDPTAPDTITPDSPLIVTFNAFIDATSIASTEVSIVEANPDCTPKTGGQPNAAVVVADAADPTSVDISTDRATAGNAWVSGTTYLVTFVAGAMAADTGKPTPGTAPLPDASALTVCFTAM